MRSNAVKQEVEKNQELIRATLRCIAVLAGISDPGVYSCIPVFPDQNF